MKKRSLVAAIAMLVVSAIVLTSSTYAWFSASNSASVGNITASVSNANGTITLAAIGTNAVNTAPTVSLARTNWTIPQNVKPVSMSLGGSTPSLATPNFNKVSFDGVTFSSFAGAAGGTAAVDTNGNSTDDYIMYQFTVNHKNASTNAATVSCDITYGGNGSYTYGLVVVDSATASEDTAELFGNDSYYPLLGLTSNVTENTGTPNSIVDTADTYVGGSTTVTAVDLAATAVSASQTTKTLTWNSPAGTAASGTTWTVTVYIWAEGQDADCTGTAPADSGSFEFDFSVA